MNKIMGIEDTEDITLPSMEFKYAPTNDPSTFVSDLKDSHKSGSEIANFHKGTTTLAFKF